MTPEHYLEKLKIALGTDLVAGILYGSTVGGDYVAGRSDYNLMLVLTTLEVPLLKKLQPATQAWTSAGNPPPLCFTLEGLNRSADVFPLEILDMKQSHRSLHGPDVFADLELSTSNLRHQLEYELKSKLILLRNEFVAWKGTPDSLWELILGSSNSFFVLCRGALRLFEAAPPADKMEAVRVLARRLDFSPEIFEIIHTIKTRQRGLKEFEPEQIFTKYLAALERVTDGVDRHLHQKE